MPNGILKLHSLGDPRIPVSGSFLGAVPNSQTTTLMSSLTIVDNDLEHISVVWPDMGPLELIGSGLNTITGELSYALTIPVLSTPGNYQSVVGIFKGEALVGRIVLTVAILDQSKDTIEELENVTPLSGVVSLLQLDDPKDFVVIPT